MLWKVPLLSKYQDHVSSKKIWQKKKLKLTFKIWFCVWFSNEMASDKIGANKNMD